MRAHHATLTVGWLVRDTFRQSISSGIGWLLAGLSTIFIVVCLTISVSGPRMLGAPGENGDFLPRFDADAHDAHKLKQSGTIVANGALRLAFGAIEVPLSRDVQTGVHFVELVLAAGVADTLGLLLTLIWTAGFLPGFLDPRAVSVLLAKPVSRGWLLIGKFLGVLVFVLAQSTYFVVGTWLALGARTGVWDPTYLLSVPLLLLHFAIFFSFSLLLAVCTRSTVVCVFGSIAFWGICWGLNYGRHMVRAAADLAAPGSFSSSIVRVADLGYWLLPKPVDLGRIVFDALGASGHFRPICGDGVSWSPLLSVLTSVAFMAYLLLAAARHWSRADY